MTTYTWVFLALNALNRVGGRAAGGPAAPLAAPLADVTDWLMDPVERALFAVIQWLAIGCWNLDRTLLTAAVQIYGWRNAFSGAGLTRVVQAVVADPTLLSLIGGALLLALLLAAIGFALRFLSPQQFDVVDLRKVVAWLALVGLLLSQGPQLIRDLETSRAGLGNAAQQVAAAISGGLQYQNPELPTGAAGELGPLSHLFPATTQLAAGQVDALDLTAAYLFAGQDDLNGTTNGGGGLPPSVQQQYFTNCAGSDCASPWPDNGMSEQGREAALGKAWDGLVRLGTGSVPALFAVEQSLVYLALAVAAAILVVALVVSLMFAWFRPTEHLPIGVLQSYLRLFILTYLASLILDILVEYARYWVTQQNWVAFLGATVLCVVIGVQPLFMSVGALRQALSAALGGQNASAGAAGAAALAGAALGGASGAGSGRSSGGGASASGAGETPPAAAVAPPGGSGRAPGELAQGQLERSRQPTTRLPGAAPGAAGAGPGAPARPPAPPTTRLDAPPEAAAGGSGPGATRRLGAPPTTELGDAPAGGPGGPGATRRLGAAPTPELASAPAGPGGPGATRRLGAAPTTRLPAEGLDATDPHVAAMNDYLAAAGIAPITSAPRRNGVDAGPVAPPAGGSAVSRDPAIGAGGAPAAGPSTADERAAPGAAAGEGAGAAAAAPLPAARGRRRGRTRVSPPAAPRPLEPPAPDLAPPLDAADQEPERSLDAADATAAGGEAPWEADDDRVIPPGGRRYTRDHGAAPGPPELPDPRPQPDAPPAAGRRMAPAPPADGRAENLGRRMAPAPPADGRAADPGAAAGAPLPPAPAAPTPARGPLATTTPAAALTAPASAAPAATAGAPPARPVTAESPPPAAPTGPPTTGGVDPPTGGSR